MTNKKQNNKREGKTESVRIEDVNDFKIVTDREGFFKGYLFDQIQTTKLLKLKDFDEDKYLSDKEFEELGKKKLSLEELKAVIKEAQEKTNNTTSKKSKFYYKRINVKNFKGLFMSHIHSECYFNGFELKRISNSDRLFNTLYYFALHKNETVSWEDLYRHINYIFSKDRPITEGVKKGDPHLTALKYINRLQTELRSASKMLNKRLIPVQKKYKLVINDNEKVLLIDEDGCEEKN